MSGVTPHAIAGQHLKQSPVLQPMMGIRAQHETCRRSLNPSEVSICLASFEAGWKKKCERHVTVIDRDALHCA